MIFVVQATVDLPNSCKITSSEEVGQDDFTFRDTYLKSRISKCIRE